jgi:hypothetical protein
MQADDRFVWLQSCEDFVNMVPDFLDQDVIYVAVHIYTLSTIGLVAPSVGLYRHRWSTITPVDDVHTNFWEAAYPLKGEKC